MTKQTKLIDVFAKVSDNYTVTNCQNGFLVEVSGEDKDEKWPAVKHVVKTIEELNSIVLDLAWMPKC